MGSAQQHALRDFLDHGRQLIDVLDDLSFGDGAQTASGRDRSMVDVAARLAGLQHLAATALGQPSTRRVSADAWAVVSAAVGNLTGQQDLDPIVTRLHEAHHAATAHLPAPPAAVLLGDTVVRTADLVRLLTVDQVLCAEDLRHELPTLKVPRAALAQAVRMLAEVMRTRHPGGSIEIRVPPFAAIQCGDPGEPRHTRGTPPNVVECQPLTFIRLCRGHDTFAAARHRNELTASGTRADISAWLPL